VTLVNGAKVPAGEIINYEYFEDRAEGEKVKVYP